MIRSFLPALIILHLCAGIAQAGEFVSAWSLGTSSRSRIVLETVEFQEKSTVKGGVQIKLDRGWWTYWRAPGSSGIPPKFDWSGSKNLSEDPELVWPTPLRASEFGEQLNLYRNEVVLPFEFHAADPSKPVVLKLRIIYGTCRNMCVPEQAIHTLSLYPAKKGKIKYSKENVDLIGSFLNRGPTSDPSHAGMSIKQVRELRSPEQLKLAILVRGLSKARSLLVLVEGAGIFQVSQVRPARSKNNQALLVVPLNQNDNRTNLTGQRLRLTIIDDARALEQIWVVGASANSLAGTDLTPISNPGPSDRPGP